MSLPVGSMAPEFKMLSNQVQEIKLSDLRGSKLLPLFVPLAFTST
jgi:peroxiredoxin